MKKVLIFLMTFLLASTKCFAQSCDVSVDGYSYCKMELIEFDAMAVPAVSPLNKARIYFDTSDLTLKCSEDGGAYQNCVGGAGGSGDITDVWSVSSGNVNALTAASGDSFNAALADSSIPGTQSTSLPATCTEGQLHQDTDSGGSESYICVLTNTWNKLATTDLYLDSLGDIGTVTTTAGRMLIADGTDYESVAISGDLTISGAGVAAVVADTIALSDLSDVNTTTKTTGRVFVADGTDFESTAIYGDVTLAASGETFIGNDKVQERMLKAIDAAGDEECLSYEATVGDFEWQICGGGSSSLLDLTDVASATVTAGRMLVADGTDWDSVAVTGDITIDGAGVTAVVANSIALSDLSDVNTTTATGGKILVADGTDFESVTVTGDITFPASGVVVIGDDKVLERMLKAVDTPADEESLTYETTTGDFEWQAAGAASALIDLTDVNTATATGGRILIADGTDWESMAVYGDVQMSAAGQALVVAETVVLTDLNDVNTATPTAGNLLVADGTDWESVGYASVGSDGSLTITGSGARTLFQTRIHTADDVPTLSSCGTSPTISATATDNGGKITVGTSASDTCTLTFSGSAWTNAPSCSVIGEDSAITLAATTTTTTLVITAPAATDFSSDVLMYNCFGQE
jgi:hypothetical protein